MDLVCSFYQSSNERENPIVNFHNVEKNNNNFNLKQTQKKLSMALHGMKI